MKILIIGVGSIGERHLNNLLKLGYRDIALADFSAERLHKLNAKHHLPVYSDWRLALRESQPELTFICTSADSHVSLAKVAIRNGSHIFIEKPLAVNLRGVDDLIRLAKQRKKIAMVACNYLFYKGLQKLRKILATELYGKPLLCRVAVSYYLPTARMNSNYKNLYAAKNNKGGGVVLDSGSHTVNYLQNLFGKIISSKVSISKTDSLKIQSEEAAVLVLEHKNGILSSVTMDYLSKKSIHRLEVITDSGLLTLDIKNSYLIFEKGNSRKIVYRGSGDLDAMFVDEVRYFIRCVKRRIVPMQSLGDARQVLDVLLSAK